MSWRFFVMFFLVCLKDPASFWGMIPPHGEGLCGDLAVMIPDDFSYKADLSFGYLAPEGGNSTETEADCFVCDVFVFYPYFTDT